ncbi:MAG: hypothetical protein VB036_14540 [Propionicimonas sp.]|nr:hypothetical protein [Propionicimonas sp.]
MKFQKKSIVAVLAGVVVAGALSASAATLGGVYRAQLGGDNAGVSSPLTKGLDVSWGTTYNKTAKAYVVNGVTVAAHEKTESIPANAQVRLTVTDADGDALGEFTSTDGGTTWSATSTAIPAAEVEGLAVVINGTSISIA